MVAGLFRFVAEIEMSDEINVIVIKRKGRKFLYLRYECPITGERFEKSSSATTETAARKKAGE